MTIESSYTVLNTNYVNIVKVCVFMAYLAHLVPVPVLGGISLSLFI